MGYIQQSNNKKIYAYLTQTGKEKLITGDTVDFQIKYFSLHDDDVNYKIASKMSGTTYNIPRSGFIPDVTGDENICLPNISDATFLEKNKLITIQVPIPTYSISPNTTTINEGQNVTFTITTTNVSDGTILYWENIGTTTASDFTQNISSGTVTINSNTASFTLNAINDSLADNGETIIINLKNQAGDILAIASTVTVSDLQGFTGGINQLCQSDGRLKVTVTYPQGGAGGPYTWYGMPVDGQGNSINTFDYNAPQPKPITQSYDFLTNFNGTNIYHKIYLKDSQGNESIIATTSTLCQAATLTLKIDPSQVVVGTVGVSNGSFAITPTDQFFSLIVTLTKSDGSSISSTERNVSFKISKNINFEQEADITASFGAFPSTTIYNFSNGQQIGSSNGLQIIIPLKVTRTNFQLDKPVSSPRNQPYARAFAPLYGGFNIKLTNVTLNGATQGNDTLQVIGNVMSWN